MLESTQNNTDGSQKKVESLGGSNQFLEQKLKELEDPEVMRNKQRVVEIAAELYSCYAKLVPDKSEQDIYLKRISKVVALSIIEQEPNLDERVKNVFRKIVNNIFEDSLAMQSFLENDVLETGVQGGEKIDLYHKSEEGEAHEKEYIKIAIEYLRSLGLDDYIMQVGLPQLKERINNTESIEHTRKMIEKHEHLRSHTPEGHIFSSVIGLANVTRDFIEYLAKKEGIDKSIARNLIEAKIKSAGIDSQIIECGREKFGAHAQISHCVQNALLPYTMNFYRNDFINIAQRKHSKDLYYAYLKSLGVPTTDEELKSLRS